MDRVVNSTHLLASLANSCRIKLVFLLVFACLPLTSFPQLSLLHTKVSGHYQDVALGDILDDLSRQTSVEFSYSANKIPVETKISSSFSGINLSEGLDLILADLPVRYILMDDYIILKKGAIPKSEKKPVNYTLNGFIRDNRTGEYLIGATVYIHELELGAITNNYGYFSITVPPGRYTLEISNIGYEATLLPVEFSQDMKLDFSMIPSRQLMEEVVIRSAEREELLLRKVASQSEVLPDQVRKQPALLGESDVLKSLDLQAGINYYSDASSYFHVRGGHYDQNLILLDEATLFNPSHLLGIFSPIIPDAVKSVDIYKSGIPAKYGGRLSSVIDIHTRDGNMNDFSAEGSIGLISGRFSVQGPFKKGKSSYFISLRRSYFDAFLKSAVPNLEALYFTDFSSKFNFSLGPRDRLFITLYRGKDDFKVRDGGDLSGIDWENRSTTLRWNHVFGEQVFLNTTLFGSTYDYYLRGKSSTGNYWNSRINNATFKQEVSYFPHPDLTMRFGYQIGFYDFNPGNYSSSTITNDYQVSPVHSLESLVYILAEHELFPWLALNYGLRLTGWRNFGEAFVVDYDDTYQAREVTYYDAGETFYQDWSLDPRMAISLKLNQHSFLKSSYTHTVQHLNLISNSVSPFSSFEVWLPTGPNIKPQLANILDVGYLGSFSEGKRVFQANLFYKWMLNQIGYTYHANMLVNPLIEGELRQGDGWAYGFELSLQREKKRFQHQLAYTFTRSFLHIEGLNGNRVFPATHDRPHTINWSFAWSVRPRWLITGNLSFSSGSRITTPTSFYQYDGYRVPVFTEQNNDRLPPYRRVDLGTTYQFNKASDNFQHSISFSIYNFFAHQNPVFLYFDKMENDDGSLEVPADRLNTAELTPSIRYTFIFMPSLTYQFSF